MLLDQTHCKGQEFLHPKAKEPVIKPSDTIIYISPQSFYTLIVSTLPHIMLPRSRPRFAIIKSAINTFSFPLSDRTRLGITWICTPFIKQDSNVSELLFPTYSSDYTLHRQHTPRSRPQFAIIKSAINTFSFPLSDRTRLGITWISTPFIKQDSNVSDLLFPTHSREKPSAKTSNCTKYNHVPPHQFMIGVNIP